MGHTCNSIFINAPVGKVFTVTNQIEKWTEIWGNHSTKITVIDRLDNKITYRFEPENGQSWTSYRLLFKEHNFVYACRLTPMFPFEYMKILWLYTEQNEGTIMTWIEQFTMDIKANKSDAEMEAFINKHSIPNMNDFKNYLEKP